MCYMNTRTAADYWNLTERRVAMLCRDGHIPYVFKQNGEWMIPADAEKPADRRRTRDSRISEGEPVSARKPLPIGISDFRELVDHYYYVDKTLLIRDFLDTRAKVTLFTRPRRFGKTLTMDMLKTFFEISEEDTSVYFSDKNIWRCGERYRKEQGRYPVVFVSFKDVKLSSYSDVLSKLSRLLSEEFNRHRELLSSDRINDYDKKLYRDILRGSRDEVALQSSLALLSRLLCTHYDKPVVIIIDEYDTPIHQGYSCGYYDEIISFMRNLFSGAFKDNSHLAYGFLTGILRVAKESLFSGLNNLKVNSIQEERYSSYFGFTGEDVRTLLDHYGAPDKYEEILEWYDGYRFGSSDLFNPWSVLNYMDENCTARAYWQSTGDSSIIRRIALEADDTTAENLHRLMKGHSISTYIDTSVTYPEIRNNPSTIYSFLLCTGYLKVVHREDLRDGNLICDVAIPNKEIFFVYEKEILSAYSHVISQDTAASVKRDIVTKDIPQLQRDLQSLLVNTISSFDYAHENFYHGLMLGLCAVMNNLYRMDSNRESGHGRYDIQLKPNNRELPGIIIELKVIRSTIPDDRLTEALGNEAKNALKQIDSREYITAMRNEGITHFLKLGIAFHKKHVEIRSAEE